MESHPAGAASGGPVMKKVAVLHGLNRPFFHLDVASALQCAVQNAEAKVALAPVAEKHVEGDASS